MGSYYRNGTAAQAMFSLAAMSTVLLLIRLTFGLGWKRANARLGQQAAVCRAICMHLLVSLFKRQAAFQEAKKPDPSAAKPAGSLSYAQAVYMLALGVLFNTFIRRPPPGLMGAYCLKRN